MNAPRTHSMEMAAFFAKEAQLEIEKNMFSYAERNLKMAAHYAAEAKREKEQWYKNTRRKA